jgi:DNA modification methylase
MTETTVAFENQVVRWDLVPADQLLANPANYREHPGYQRDALRGSLQELGFIAPVLVNLRTGRMIDGHARTEEVLSVDPHRPIPVAYVDMSEEDEAKALLIFDRITSLAGVDKEKLADLMRDVSFATPGLQKMVADFAREQKIVLGGGPETPDPGAQTEKAAELQEKWATERGQLWSIGPHWLMIGDATDVHDVTRLLGLACPSLMVTDPPYGVSYDPKWRKEAKRSSGKALSTGNVSMGEVANDDQCDWTLAWELFPGDVCYVWHGGKHAGAVAQSLEAVGFEIRNQIIWVKQGLVIGRGNYHWQHEPCYYAVKKNGKSHWCGDRTQSTAWFINNASGNGTKDDIDSDHGTQKPLLCMRRPIDNNSIPGDGVYDPFLGSGTTMVACEQSGRVCFGMELDPGYAAVVLERLSGMGLEPRLSDGPQR